MNKNIRPIALYLPQYHPIPENDEWWGKGFTEWRNVINAKPRFEGHYQPHIPTDLGFYDLRLEEVREEQAKLAKKYGIYGFCYYHYWFNGRRILERPFQEVFDSEKPDFPFCLCWANENWTRAWDGSEKEILLKQDYSEEDDRNHIKYLIPYFKDKRYIKVNDKPVFIFYKTDLFPNMQRTIEIFREEALKEGLELYLCRFERWIGDIGKEFSDLGFDSAIEFQPLSASLKKYVDLNDAKTLVKRNVAIKTKIVNAIPYSQNIKNRLRPLKNKFFNKKVQTHQINDRIIDYKSFVDFDLKQESTNYKCFPGVCPMWDNSSRRVERNALIFKNSSPEKFEYWYKSKLEKFEPYSKEENFIFINAWNEWAEGNHLEPCQKWGLDYLKKIKL